VRHSEIQARMADYLEGDLPLQKRALFDAHLDTCEQCAQDLKELRTTISLLRGLPDPEPPADLVDNAMRRIRAGEAQPTVGDRIREWLSSLAAPGFAVPATAVVAAMALALLSGQLDPSQLGLGSPRGTEIAAERPEARPPRVVAQLGTETQVASRVSPSVPTAPSPRVQTPVSRSLPVADSTVSPSLAGPSGGRTLVRLRIARNQPEDVAPWIGNRPWSLGAPPTGVLVGTSPRSELSSANASGARGFVSSEGRAMRPLEPAASPSPSDSAFAGSSREEEESARAEFRRQQLDLRLNFLLRSPGAFASEFGGLSAGEQELWLRAIAEHALESEVADRAVAALRSTQEAGALALAETFEAELEILQDAAFQGSPSGSSTTATEGTP
jgi:anti-sigma factor RsiW